MSYLTFDEKMKLLIKVIENSNEFDFGSLGGLSGLGEEAVLLYRNYISGKALSVQASVNYFRIGLQDTQILIKVDHRLMKVLYEAAQILLSTPGYYLAALGAPLGQNLFITRHLIPKAVYRDYLGVLEELLDEGIIEGYEAFADKVPAQRYSLDPSIFDYATGGWKLGTYTFRVKRELRTATTDPVPFDEVDLKIVSMLRESATTSLQAMAAATGLSVDEALVHLRDHVLGGGDRNKSMIFSYFVHFMEPGLFAPDTMMLNFIGETDHEDELIGQLASIPYVWQIHSAENVNALLYGPLQGLYAIWHEVESAAHGAGAKDVAAFISPWYSYNVLGSLKSPVTLDRNFRDGRWIFDADDIVEFIKNKVKAEARG